MTKYYRVIKENFLWEVGAIISNKNGDGFFPVEDIWNKTKEQDEWISETIVEGQPEYFQRVCPGIKDKVFYTVEQFKKIYNSKFKK